MDDPANDEMLVGLQYFQYRPPSMLMLDLLRSDAVKGRSQLSTFMKAYTAYAFE